VVRVAVVFVLVLFPLAGVVSGLLSRVRLRLAA
jgi:hypothetical protein